MRIPELKDRLVECGLTDKESSIFLALALRGPLKASEVGKGVSISRADAYNSLRTLQQRGIVEATLEKPMRFVVLPVEQALELVLQEKRSDIERIERNKALLAEQLKAPVAEAAPVDAAFKIITDRRSIAANVLRMVAEATAEVDIVSTAHGLSRLHTLGVLAEAGRAAERGVRVRILAPIDTANIAHAERALDCAQVRHSEGVAGEAVLADRKAVVSSLSFDDAPASKGKDDIAIWTNSPDFVHAQGTFFDSAWEAAHEGRARVTEVRTGLIVEPLNVTLGEGSMYERLKAILKQRATAARGRGVIRIGAQAPPGPLSEFEQFGIDTSDILNAIGKRIGKEIANQMKAEERQGFFDELKSTWAELTLGAVEVEDGEHLQITVRDSFSCHGMAGVGRPLCALDEGILTGVIEQKLHLACETVERSCVGLGNDHCTYEVTFAAASEPARPAGGGAAARTEALAPHA